MLALLIFAFIMNIFMTGSMVFFIGMIRSIQIILHLPLFQINSPAIVTCMFELIIPIAMFDIFELFQEYPFFEDLMTWLIGEVSGQEVKVYESKWTNSVNLGYDT